MFRNSYQHGAFCILHSGGSKPFELWDVKVQDGYLERYLDRDLKKMVIEIGGTNVSTTYITCPKDKKVLGISMPYLIMTVKNLKRYFTFEITILDNTNTRRRFRVANFQSTTQIFPFCTAMPISLADGWNQIQFNLAEFTSRAYQRDYIETQNLKVNASIRIRQIYFSERLFNEEELPPLLQLHLPRPLPPRAPNPSLEKFDKSETQATKTSTESVGSTSKPHTDSSKKSSKEKVAVESEKGLETHLIKKASMGKFAVDSKNGSKTQLIEKASKEKIAVDSKNGSITQLIKKGSKEKFAVDSENGSKTQLIEKASKEKFAVDSENGSKTHFIKIASKEKVTDDLEKGLKTQLIKKTSKEKVAAGSETGLANQLIKKSYKEKVAFDPEKGSETHFIKKSSKEKVAVASEKRLKKTNFEFKK